MFNFHVFIDPNDVESPRTSFVMGSKLGLTHQNAPVSPNAEDLNLLLGSMTRGRSFSTTTNPKPAEMNQIISAAAKDKNPDAVTVQRRKKSVPNTQKEKFV